MSSDLQAMCNERERLMEEEASLERTGDDQTRLTEVRARLAVLPSRWQVSERIATSLPSSSAKPAALHLNLLRKR